jgi:hypothetical protein
VILRLSGREPIGFPRCQLRPIDAASTGISALQYDSADPTDNVQHTTKTRFSAKEVQSKIRLAGGIVAAVSQLL